MQASHFADSVIENIPNMIFVKDATNLRFVRFNRAGEELLGLARSDLIGKTDFDFFPEDEAQAFQAKDRSVLEGNKIVDIPEERISTKSQGVRILHTKKIPIYDESGKPRYLVGISISYKQKWKSTRSRNPLSVSIFSPRRVSFLALL
jgi:PAS domain S-box-containing protein